MPDGPGRTRTRASTPATAADQLERILYILPMAARKGGVMLEELARSLAVSAETVSRDITDVTNRAFYHPAGSGSDLQVSHYGDRVEIFTGNEFRRPVRFSVTESVCLGLALRGACLGAALGAAPGDPAAEPTGGAAPASAPALTRLEAALGRVEAEELLRELDLGDLSPGACSIRDVVTRCLHEQVSVRILYLKPSDTAPMERTVHPYALIHAEGHWYVPAWCETSQDVRSFRMDRILSAAPTGAPYEIPAAFDPESCIQGGKVYRGGEEVWVRVRYSPAIARWIAEREEGEWDFEGGLVVTHQVVDPQWIVRHVLQYGPDAEVMSPEEARAWVRNVVAPPVPTASPPDAA